jgi:hypothetical protein
MFRSGNIDENEPNLSLLGQAVQKWLPAGKKGLDTI